jgi:hypothetical protein
MFIIVIIIFVKIIIMSLSMFYTVNASPGEVPKWAKVDVWLNENILDWEPDMKKRISESEEGKDVKAILVYRCEAIDKNDINSGSRVYYDLIKK